jgi:hypothetical protein
MEGRWAADAAEHQRQLDATSLPMTVEPGSASTLTIQNGAFVADNTLTITMKMASVAFRSSGTTHIEGTFAFEGDVLRAAVTVLNKVDGDMVGVMPDGSTIPLPAGGAPAASPAVPQNSFEGTNVTCTDSTLTFDPIGTDFGSITYTRVR